MIDVSPLLLWPVADVLELMPIDSADEPSARRLSVLAAEAQAAGHSLALLAWWCDVAHVLLLTVPASCNRVALMTAVTLAERVAVHGKQLSAEEFRLLFELCEQTGSLSSTDTAAAAIAGWTLGVLDRLPLAPTDAWQVATELLAAVARAAGTDAAQVLSHCAELAYARLFPRADRARV
jgi:hypothetical protein